MVLPQSKLFLQDNFKKMFRQQEVKAENGTRHFTTNKNKRTAHKPPPADADGCLIKRQATVPNC
jgi:hypothetical protein